MSFLGGWKFPVLQGEPVLSSLAWHATCSCDVARAFQSFPIWHGLVTMVYGMAPLPTWLRRHTWGSHFLNHLALRWIAWKSLWADVGVNVVSLHKACWVAIVHWVTLIVIIVILLALWTVVIGNNFKLLWLFSTCLSWLFCSSTFWVLLGHSQAIVCASLGYWLRTCSTMTGTEIDDFGIWLHHCIEWIHGEKLHHGRARLRVERRSTYVSPFLFTLGLWFCVGLWLLSGGFCSFLTRNQNFLHISTAGPLFNRLPEVN